MEHISKLAKHQQTSSQNSTPQINIERWKLIKGLICQNYDACNCPLPQGKDLDFKTDTFYGDLNGIPTSTLSRVFREARKSKFTPFPPSTGEIWKAWENVKGEIERKRDEEKKRSEPKVLSKPIDLNLFKECERIAFLPKEERVLEFEKLHGEYPYAGFLLEAEKLRESLNWESKR